MKVFALALIAFLAVSAYAKYDSHLGELFLRVADMAYCCEKNLKADDCGPVCSQLGGIVQYDRYFEKGVNGDDQVAYVASKSDSMKLIFISFRGTNTIYQLLLEGLQEKNEAYDIHDVPKACVQSVFFDRYKIVRDQMLSDLKSLLKENPDYSLVVTGHSLGGALSTFAALDIVLLGILPSDRVSNYPYASPRVGNYAYAQKYNEMVPNTYRVVHWNDIFVTWPVSCDRDSKKNCITGVNDPDYGTPGGKFFGWHIDGQVFYNKDQTSYQECSAEDPDCANQWHSIFYRSIPAHLNYLGVGMGCGSQQIPQIKIAGEKMSDCVHLPTLPLMNMLGFNDSDDEE